MAKREALIAALRGEALLDTLFKPEVAGPEFIHEFENSAATARYASQRIVGNDHRHARFFGDQFVDITQQGAAASLPRLNPTRVVFAPRPV